MQTHSAGARERGRWYPADDHPPRYGDRDVVPQPNPSTAKPISVHFPDAVKLHITRALNTSDSDGRRRSTEPAADQYLAREAAPLNSVSPQLTQPRAPVFTADSTYPSYPQHNTARPQHMPGMR